MLQKLGICKDILISLRAHHYLKNLFIFLPAFFAFKISDPIILSKTIYAFISFSLTASGIYIFNDIVDSKRDSLHPKKKFRPIASGRISKKLALSISIFLLAFSFAISLKLDLMIFVLILFYVLLNISYSLILKKFPLIDVCTIALGFVIRLFIGSIASNVYLSNWIVTLTFLLSLFLAFSKRRDDLVLNHSHETRESMKGYSLEFINSSMNILAAMTILSYVLWSISPEVIDKFNSDKIYLSSIFVILGVFRYLQHAYLHNDTGSPTKVLLKDVFLQITIISWALSLYIVFYLF